MDFKKELASEVVRQFHGSNMAQRAREEFEKTIQQGEIPAEMPMVSRSSFNDGDTIIDLLVREKLADSRGGAKRLILQGGVAINGQQITDVNKEVMNLSGNIRAGKRRWLKLI